MSDPAVGYTSGDRSLDDGSEVRKGGRYVHHFRGSRSGKDGQGARCSFGVRGHFQEAARYLV